MMTFCAMFFLFERGRDAKTQKADGALIWLCEKIFELRCAALRCAASSQ